MTQVFETRYSSYPSLQFLEAGLPHSDFSQQLKFAEGRSNTLRHNVRTAGTSFSDKLEKAWEHEKTAHHGHHHSRHVEELVEMGVNELSTHKPELFQGDDAFTDLSALMIQPYFHDLDQLMGTIRNMDTLREKPLKEKKGHGPGGSLMMLALAPEYAQAAGIPFDEAWEVMCVATVMSMSHDKPEQFDQTFNLSNQKAYVVDEQGNKAPLSGDVLFTLFKEDKLDLFSLSPAQLVEIVAMEKEPYGFLDPAEGSQFGLDPDFEQERRQILEVIRAQDTPMLDHLSDERKQRIRQLAEVNYWADMGDMISPYMDQFPRTFLTQYSRQRPFSSFHQGQLTSEEAFEMALNGRGEHAQSDDIRLCWEIVHAVDGISPESDFNKLPGIKQFTKEHVILSAIELRKLGEAIMSGNESMAAEIRRIYGHRLRKFDAKRQDVEERGIHVNGNYSSKVRMIEDESAEVIDSLAQKSREYTSDDIQQFQQLLDSVVDYLQVRFQISDDEMDQYQQLVEEGADAPSQPFSNDSLPIKGLKVM